MPPFLYNVLNRQDPQIRLLEVCSSTQDGAIRCRLTTYDFETAPPFTALSYTWGSGLADCSILVNEQRCQVGKNLWRFLSQIAAKGPSRRTSYDRMFWIDAICINQIDQEERTHQVSRMAEIYETAKQVLVWLGPAHSGSDTAMSQMAGIRVASAATQAQRLKILRQVSAFPVLGLCSRPYWTRLWIFQELALARTIILMCGAYSVTWEAFLFVVAESKLVLNQYQVRRQPQMYEMLWDSPAFSIAEQIVSDTRSRSLFDLIQATRHLRCAETLDKIYALLGVAHSGHEDIEPKYQRHPVCVLNEVLRNHHRTTPPRSLSDVVQQCRQLSVTFGFPPDAMFSLREESPEKTGLQALSDRGILTEFPLHIGPGDTQPVSLWWACLYEHVAVQRLIFKQSPDLGAYELLRFISIGDTAAAEFLLRAEDISCKAETPTGQQSLHLAVQTGQLTILESLLSRGVLDKRDFYGNAPAHVAVSSMQYEALRILLKHALRRGGQIHLDRNANGQTALHGAARGCQTNMVKLLVKAPFRAAASVVDSHGRTPLDIAVIKGHVEAIPLLTNSMFLKSRAWTFQPRIAFKNGRGGVTIRRECFHAVIAVHPRPRTSLPFKSGSEFTSLSDRVESEFKPGFPKARAQPEYWSDEDCCLTDVDLESRSGQSQFSWKQRDPKKNVLHLAAENGRTVAMILLLGCNLFDVNQLNSSGRTPLVSAARKGSVRCVEELLACKKCDPDFGYLSPLHDAVQRNISASSFFRDGRR